MKVGPVHCNSLLGTAKALGGAKSEQVLERQAQNAFLQAEFERYRTMAFLSASLPDLPPLLLLFLFMVSFVLFRNFNLPVRNLWLVDLCSTIS